MTLLRDIQHEAASGKAPVSQLLRKCKILAARLKSAEFSAWIDRELNGYGENDDLPKYRVLKGLESHGHFVGAYRSELRNGRIPSHVLPEPLNEQITELHLTDPIASYEDLLLKAKDDLHVDWPTDLVAAVGRRIYEDMSCMAAWRIVPRSALASLVDVVRNRVLGLVLELEEANPNAGEASSSETPVAPSVVHQAFHTHIYGSVGNIATASSNVVQTAEVNIVARGDIAGLRTELLRLGLPAEDIAELETALAEDKHDNEPGIGRRAAAWLGRTVVKASSGAWQVSLQTAAAVLPKMIGAYLGLPPSS